MSEIAILKFRKIGLEVLPISAFKLKTIYYYNFILFDRFLYLLYIHCFVMKKHKPLESLTRNVLLFLNINQRYFLLLKFHVIIRKVTG